MASKKGTIPRPKRVSKAASSGSSPVNAPARSLDPQALTLTQNKLSLGRVVRGIVIVLVAFFAVRYLWRHRPISVPVPDVPLPAPSKPNLAWGPKIKLQVVSKIAVGAEVLALRVDKLGNIYVLNRGRISAYKPDGTAGVVTGGIDLGVGAEWENMAFDGNHFYVTMGDDSIVKVAKDLSKVEKTIHVKGAAGLFGIAVSPQGGIYVGDEQMHTVFILDSDGKKTGQFGGPAVFDGSLVCPVDLAFDDAGGIYTHDHLTFLITHFSPGGKMIASWPVPWASHNWERLAVLGNKAYIDGFNDKRLFVQDLLGHNIAQCVELSDGTKLDHPQMVGAGMDGFLYVDQDNFIYKLKPWEHAAPTPSEDAPMPVSPAAAKKG
jgi:hypothetical protein